MVVAQSMESRHRPQRSPCSVTIIIISIRQYLGPMKYFQFPSQVATDPALAWKKAKELFATLSAAEPENQARPATLEELVVLLTRETARKMVHLINYTHTDLPK